MDKIDSFSGEHRFLSNFWYHPIRMGGEMYPTNEHAFQAAKTLQSKEREHIRLANTPGDAKHLGRVMTLRKDWEEVKLEVMYRINRQKFRYNEELKDKLLSTLGSELVEGNHWGDTFWGVCDGVGENHLGKILMRIRSELKAERADEDNPNED